MAYQVRLLQGAAVPTVITDSATALTPAMQGYVAVCGSHGGVVATRFGAAAGVRALIVNDAGVGKEQAGINGVIAADDWGMAAAAVSHDSARIGDGEDTYSHGVISFANASAESVGVRPGMTAQEAAERLAAWSPRSAMRLPDPEPPRRIVLADSSPPVLALDSASQVDATVAAAVVVCGSHGGLVGGKPIRHPVVAALFNDAGIGRDDAGVQRLPALAAMGIPACAVSHLSARIGDAVDAYRNGVVSRVNQPAAAAGIQEGMMVRRATELLVHDAAARTARGKERGRCR